MEILNPCAQFLRVSDKFFPEFIFMDEEIGRGALLSYLFLFRCAGKSGICQVSQRRIARFCRSSVRSVQHYLRVLIDLGYVSVAQQDEGCNVYRLALSERVKRFIAQWQEEGDFCHDTEGSSGHAQNLRMAGENSAPYIKSYKSNNNTPLSPLPAAPRETASSRKPFHAASGHAVPAGQRRGDSFSPAGKDSAAVAADDFESLWAAWPVKKDKAVSRRIFFSKARLHRLPALSVLLKIVERFKAVDRHWRNNCAPLLSTWLRGDRWQDEPLLDSAAPSPEPAPALPLPPVPDRQETPEEKARAQNYRAAVEDLQALCPSASRNGIHAALALARARGIGFADVAARARAHLCDNVPYFSLVDWIRQGVPA